MRWWALLVLGGCSFSGGPFGGDGDGDLDPDQTPEDINYVSVSGAVVDFLDGAPVAGATIEGVDLTGGVIEVTGSDFTVTRVLPHSVFRLKVTSPEHAATISALIEVGDEDVSGVTLEVVGAPLIDAAYSAAGVSPSGGILISRLFDTETGAPVAGVSSDAFTVGDEVVFLDNDNQVSADAPASTGAGVGVILNVDPGLVELESAAAEHTFSAPATRVESGVVSIVDIEIGLEPPEIPTGKNFRDDILPIFEARGCDNCHQGNGPGRQQGGFSLNGNIDARHAAVLERVDLDVPEDSLLLHKPSFEDPPDGHQIVFANRADADYLTMLGWIIDGAPL